MIWVFRSDADEAHRLSLSGRVLTAHADQVKNKHDARSQRRTGTSGIAEAAPQRVWRSPGESSDV